MIKLAFFIAKQIFRRVDRTNQLILGVTIFSLFALWLGVSAYDILIVVLPLLFLGLIYRGILERGKRHRTLRMTQEEESKIANETIDFGEEIVQASIKFDRDLRRHNK